MIIEILRNEMLNCADVTKIRVGNYLIDRFSNDQVLKEKAEKINLSIDGVFSYLHDEAKKLAGSGAQSIMISDEDVFNMIIHGIDEELISKESPAKKAETKKTNNKKEDVDLFNTGLFAFNSEDNETDLQEYEIEDDEEYEDQE